MLEAAQHQPEQIGIEDFHRTVKERVAQIVENAQHRGSMVDAIYQAVTTTREFLDECAVYDAPIADRIGSMASIAAIELLAIQQAIETHRPASN